MASFLVALLTLGLDAMLLFVLVLGAARAAGDREIESLEDHVVGGGILSSSASTVPAFPFVCWVSVWDSWP